MRKIFLSAMFALAVLGFQGEAKAQFCPGAPGTVFIDVPLSDPFCSSITWIAERGVTLGCQVINGAQSLYCPNDNVDRTQMADVPQPPGQRLVPAQLLGRPGDGLERHDVGVREHAGRTRRTGRSRRTDGRDGRNRPDGPDG